MKARDLVRELSSWSVEAEAGSVSDAEFRYGSERLLRDAATELARLKRAAAEVSEILSRESARACPVYGIERNCGCDRDGLRKALVLLSGGPR